jgi:multimeric flavodoxin WrbA
LEHEIIRLAEMEIAPCTGCVRCARSKRCVQQDDMALCTRNWKPPRA